MKPLFPMAAILCLVAACSDQDHSQASSGRTASVPAPGVQNQNQAQIQAQAGPAPSSVLGLSPVQLSRARLVTAQGVVVGRIDGVQDARVVVTLDAPGAPQVLVPVSDLRRGQDARAGDLITEMTPAQLQALPAFTPNMSSQNAQ